MDAMLFSIKNSEQEVSIFNLASQGTTTVKFIADTVVKKMNPKTRIVYGTEDRGWKGDVPYTWLDGSLLNQLGWKANLSSDQAVEKSIEQHLRAEGLL
jgi:UDP-glucose 4-epimerase